MISYFSLSVGLAGIFFLIGLCLRRSAAGLPWFPWASLLIFLTGLLFTGEELPGRAGLVVRVCAVSFLLPLLFLRTPHALAFLPLILFFFDWSSALLPGFASLLIQPAGWSYLVLRAYDASRAFRTSPTKPGEPDRPVGGHPPFGRRLKEFVLQAAPFPTLLTGPVLLRGHYALRRTPFSLRQAVDRRAAGLVVLGFLKIFILLPWWNAHMETGVLRPFQWNLEAFRNFVAAGIYGYGRLLLDFSGAADLAVGLCGIIGLRIRHNFHRPWAAVSVSEFWRRWHITLGSFVRRHIYLPMGGSRRGPARTILNISFAMLVIGLWHGLRWNFLIWGLLHAALMIAERILLPARVQSRTAAAARIILTQFLIACTWTVFFWEVR